MKIRRTISIDKKDLDALKPLLESSGNNLSHALRQLIDYYRQQTNMDSIGDSQQRLIMLRNQIIENRIAVLVPNPLIKWLLKRNPCVPPLGTFRVIMEKYTKMLGIDNFSLNDYVRMVNTHGDIFGYQISQHIELSPDSRNMRIFFEAEDPDNLKGAVINYSCMLAHHPLKLKTIKVTESPNLFIVDYEQCSKEKEAYESVISHFGGNQLLLDEIQSNIQFWRNAVNIIKADGHEDVIISRDILQRFLKSHDFSEQLSNLISIIYGVSIEDSEYQDLNGFIEEICATSGLIYRIEYDYNEIKIYHKFNDSNIINIINGTVIKTFEISGHHFMLKKDGKMTILSRRVV